MANGSNTIVDLQLRLAANATRRDTDARIAADLCEETGFPFAAKMLRESSIYDLTRHIWSLSSTGAWHRQAYSGDHVMSCGTYINPKVLSNNPPDGARICKRCASKARSE